MDFSHELISKFAESMSIDIDEISLRKEYLQLNNEDVSLLQQLNQRIKKKDKSYIADFYSHLLSFKEIQSLINDDSTLERLRKSQAIYFNELTSGNYDWEYVLKRLKVGYIHQQVGLEPKWYLGAYNSFLSEIIPKICSLFNDDYLNAIKTIQALLKIVFFDMGFSLESYFQSNIKSIVKLKEFSENIISNMPAGLAVLDESKNIILANDTFYEMFSDVNRNKENYLDRYFSDSELSERLNSALKQDKKIHNYKYFDKVSHKYMTVSMSPTVLDELDALLVIVKDITEQEKLFQSEKDSKSKIDAILQNVFDGIITFNEQGLIKTFNKSAERIFEYKGEEVIGRHVSILIKPETQNIVENDVEFDLLNYNKILRSKLRDATGKRKSGDAFPVDLSVSKIPEGNELTYTAVIRDMTSRKKIERKMKTLSSAIEQTADSVIITNQHGMVTYVNLAFENMTGYCKDEIIGRTPNIVKSGTHDKEFYNNLWSTITTGEVFIDIFVNRKKDGELYYEEKTITPILNEAGDIIQYVSTGKNITERMKAQERLNYIAHHDTLTDLPNRMLLAERMTQAIKRAKWQKRIIALLFIDIDRFKNVNDTLGHDIGDELLKKVALRLHETVRDGDTVARLGGDEFGILLTDIAHESDVTDLSEKLLLALSKAYTVDANELYATASIGISLFPNDGDTDVTLLKNADTAMYQAKEKGKNTFQYYSHDMGNKAKKRLSLETNMRRAIENEEFILHYQPQIELLSNKIRSVEALIRWNNPEQGLIPPNDFIPFLEETGLIIPVGKWIISEAVKKHEKFLGFEHGPELISINLSGKQFLSKDLAGYILDVIEASSLSAKNIELEITESLLMENIEETIKVLSSLKELGVKIAVDDFGTGYSSLSYLKRLPIDVLKLDRSFVKDLDNDTDSTSIASAIISLGHDLGMEVIAEGVETESQLRFLAEKKCDIAQGYLFSKPVPSCDIKTFLKKHKKNMEEIQNATRRSLDG